MQQKTQILPNLQKCIFLIPEKTHTAYSLYSYQLSREANIYLYTHILYNWATQSSYRRERYAQIPDIRMPSFPLLRNSASPEKQTNIFTAACNASEKWREADHPCGENWILPTPFLQDLVLTSMKGGSIQPH